MSCVLQIPLSESWPLYPVTEELTMIIFYKKGGGYKYSKFNMVQV